MLISKCTIFGSEANQQLVSMYIAQNRSLTKPELNGVDPDWWHEVLRRKMPEETRRQLTQAFFAYPNTYANDFMIGAFNEEERVMLYKWALGLRYDQEISLGELIGKDEQQLIDLNVDELYKLAHKAIDDKGQWHALKHYLPLVPVPKCIEQAVSTLIWQIREIIITAKGKNSVNDSFEKEVSSFPVEISFINDPSKRYTWANGSFEETGENSIVENSFISGAFNSYLWEHASNDIVQKLLDEYYATRKPPANKACSNYHARAILALKNDNVDEWLKDNVFESLFNHSYGQVDIGHMLQLHKGGCIPDRHFQSVINEIIDIIQSATKYHNLMVSDQESDLTAFMNDPRITSSDRNKIFGLLEQVEQHLDHEYFKQPDGTYKHVRELSDEEVITFLELSTMGLVTPSGISSDYEAMAMALIEDNFSEPELMDLLDSKQREFSALFKNDMLSEDQIKQLINVLIYTNQSYMLRIFMVDNNTPNKVFEDIDDSLRYYKTHFPGSASMKHDSFSRSICQIYLSRINEQAEYAEKYLMKHVSEEGFWVKESNFSDDKANPPYSLYGLLAAMDHRPGKAFSVLEQHLTQCPSLDVGPVGSPDWQRLGSGPISEINKVAALTKWVMTQDIYPALLGGSDLAPNVLAKTLALAVRDCQVDAFDIQVLSHTQEREHFDMVAGLLLENPLFGERHPEAYEALTAEMLKRKADACMTSVMNIKPSRPHL